MAESTATESTHPTGPVTITTIQLVHARLFARYGSAWRAKYAGLAVEVVEKDWFHELNRLPLWAIDFALDHLPDDFTPTAGQFRTICTRSPPPPPVRHAIEAPPPDPERVKTVLAGLRNIGRGVRPTDWIARLEAVPVRQRTIFQNQCLAEARANLAHRVDDVPATTPEDSRRLDAAKKAQAARVAQYLRDHPELNPIQQP